MGKKSRPRSGSLQFYPRKRAEKILPRCSWKSLERENFNLLGFLGYKVGMTSAFVKDNSTNSLTKGQRITIPVTIIECPKIKILSVRFYKNNKVIGEYLNEGLDKELKKKIKIPEKHEKKKLDELKKNLDFDDIRVIVYSQVKKTGIKKSPDIVEIGLSGKKDEKLNFVDNNLNKEISIKEVFAEGLIDIKGVTKGKGLQGPTKRFGISLKSHKSEKGVRGPGSIGPCHPARVDFTIPMAGQMGFFTRVQYNNKIIEVGSINEKDINFKNGFKHFGKIKTDYLIVQGSVQGPPKRPMLIMTPYRPIKKQEKKNYELIELR
jgi:large subunit ribosomal protein L3